MNIKDLAKQAGFDFDDYYDSVTQEELERFADLVRDDERGICAEHYLVIVEQIRKDEREACAQVCDVMAKHPEYAESATTKLAAAAIRARM